MRRRRPGMRLVLPLACAVLAGLVAAGCSDEGGSGTDDPGSGKPDLVIYSGREEELAKPLYEQFEQQTGLKLEVRYAESPELAATLLEEGDRSPADLFFAQDAGALGSVSNLLAALPDESLDKVDPRWRDSGGRWVGVTGRVRVLIYNTRLIRPRDLPTNVRDLTDVSWKGKIGVAPTNASFQGFVTGMRLAVGEQETLEFLEDLDANDPQVYQKNSQIADAVARGEVQVGLVNHYYLYEQLERDPDLPLANHFFEAGDPGTLVNVSAVGVLDSAAHATNAERFVAFLLDEGQRFIASDAPEREYPLVAGVKGTERAGELPALDAIHGPQLDLSKLGDELDATVSMIEKSGLAG